MATPRWIAAAQDIAEIRTVTVTGYDAATTYKITINNKVISTIAAGSAALTATALVTAWNASEEPECAEITASSPSSAVFTLTHDTAGVPFTVAASVSGGSGTIGSFSTSTAATGKHFWNNAANWSTGSVPVNSDSVYFDNSDVSVKYGLDQSAVTVTLLEIAASYTGNIGLPEMNIDGSEYHEYRATYLAIGATTCNIGNGVGNGSQLIKINNGSVQTALTVFNTSTSTDANLEALQWKGTHASNTVKIVKGQMAIAGYGADVATVATLTVGYVTSPESDVTLRCGAGSTLTTLNMQGGQVTTNSAMTTVNKYAGTLTHKAGAITTLNDDGGTTRYNSSGTITAANIGSGATLDFSQNPSSCTVSACDAYEGAAILDPNKKVTWSAGIDLNRAGVAGVSLNLGENIRLTPGAVA